MAYKKPILLLLILVFSLGFVNSLSVSVDSPLSQGQQWSINANLSSLNNGENVRIYLDSEQIFVVTKVDNLYLEVTSSSRVVNSILNKDNGFLTLVCSGLSTGNYDIELKSSNDSVGASVVFFEPSSKSDQEKLENDVSILEGQINSLKSTISTLEQQNQVKDSQISDLLKENSELDSALILLESKLRLLEQEGKSSEEIILEMKSDLNDLLVERENQKNSPLSGMFAFGAQNSGILIGLFALIALIVVGIFIRSRTGSIYSSSLFGDDDVAPDLNPVESDESSLNETRVSPFKSFFSGLKKKKSPVLNSNKKKWAVEPYHGEEKNSVSKEEKRFDLGDLIKKD